VGQKIDLDYNIETMRITDPGIDDAAANAFRKPSAIMDSIKARSTVAEGDSEEPSTAPPMIRAQPRVDTPRVDADVQSAKLKQLLGKIKAS
jgi:type IV secretory pathway VirD2 relaxase